MKPYEIKHMIIDDEFHGEESVTADFIYNNKDYSITFKKTDFEMINSWVFEGDTSIPANLSDNMIESIREDVKERI
ncbi:putative iron-regulated protein [Bacillus fengqiuensis]|nr:putative iron-regulated protein [Bacillus fengqiuensis]